MINDWLSIDETQLESALGRAFGPNIDSADLYLQQTQEESWSLEDAIVKEGGFSIDRGFGFRVISGEKTGFAYADQIELSAIIDAAKSARSIVHAGGSQLIKSHSKIIVPQLYPAINPLTTVSDPDKVLFLKELDVLARNCDSRVKQVMLSLSASRDVMMVLNTEGLLSSDVRPLVHFSVRIVVEAKGRFEQASAGCGGRGGYDLLMRPDAAVMQVKRAVAQAIRNLDAIPAPAGTFPVVLGPGWPAVLFHEAVGHGLEGDFNRKKTSVFSGKMGEKVASHLCTVVDDGTIYGRRESYASLPMPRMTNTYLLPGQSTSDEIIASVEKGIYAADFSGGQVDITSGKFVFTASEAYLIENGKITRPIKGATLVGSGHEVLKKISMVGNDLKLDSGIGNCGKAGQTIPVGVGQPTLKIESMTVGGVEKR